MCMRDMVISNSEVVGQQFLIAQWFGAMATDVEGRGSILTESMFLRLFLLHFNLE